MHCLLPAAAFLEDNSETLVTIPAPMVALNYYLNEDLYLFDEFQTASKVRPMWMAMGVGVGMKQDCH